MLLNKLKLRGQNNLILRTKNNNTRKLFFGIMGCKIKINGKNNRIILQGKHSCCKNSDIEIVGDNNTIVLNGNKLISTKLIIDGDNNFINLGESVKYMDTLISEEENNNIFEIGKTSHYVKQAIFFVEDGGIVKIGENSELKNRGLHVVVNNGYKKKPKLILGDNVCIAKDCIIRTSDGHSIIDENGNAINEPKDVIIGNNVWIMSRCTILKGTKIPNNSGVGANSLVNKKFENGHVLIAGSPAKVIKENFKWSHKSYDEIMYEHEKKYKDNKNDVI